MKTLYLVRHAEYDNSRNIIPGRLPVPLSQKGIVQSQKLAKYFFDKNITSIYSSAVKRCRQTSQIIAKNAGFDIKYDPRLLETLSAYQGYWGENKHKTGFHFFSHIHQLGGESFSQIQKRVVSFYKEIIEKEPHTCIICSHGDPLYLLYNYLKTEKMNQHSLSTSTPPDYQPKASIRPIIIDQSSIEIKQIIDLQ